MRVTRSLTRVSNEILYENENETVVDCDKLTTIDEPRRKKRKVTHSESSATKGASNEGNGEQQKNNQWKKLHIDVDLLSSVTQLQAISYLSEIFNGVDSLTDYLRE